MARLADRFDEELVVPARNKRGCISTMEDEEDEEHSEGDTLQDSDDAQTDGVSCPARDGQIGCETDEGRAATQKNGREHDDRRGD